MRCSVKIRTCSELIPGVETAPSFDIAYPETLAASQLRWLLDTPPGRISLDEIAGVVIQGKKEPSFSMWYTAVRIVAATAMAAYFGSTAP